MGWLMEDVDCMVGYLQKAKIIGIGNMADALKLNASVTFRPHLS
jgi:hypothetical protein